MAVIEWVLCKPAGGCRPGVRFVSQLFPRLPRGFRGTVEINSLVPVQLVTLRSPLTGDRFLLAAFHVCRLDAQHGVISRMKPDGSGLEVFATGIRNTVRITYMK